MKQWISKLLGQFDIKTALPNEKISHNQDQPSVNLSDEKATVLYFLDIYNKSLLEIENHSIRKVRDKLDQLSRNLIDAQNTKDTEAALFEMRQFFSSYRIDESTYIQNSFDDFKRIVWDFADQLSEDMEFEDTKEKALSIHLQDLKEAVDMNSIELLRQKSRHFINSYVEYQNQKNEMKQKKLSHIKKNLSSIKKKLSMAHHDLQYDHLTGAYNRRFFEEKLKIFVSTNRIENKSATLIMLDIDHFKKINDTYGHDIGDFVLKQCVTILKECFNSSTETIARLGGEEFAVLLENIPFNQALSKAENALIRIRNEVFIQGSHQIRFTISMGIAESSQGEKSTEWLKRSDLALYQSKNNGRNKITVAQPNTNKQVA